MDEGADEPVGRFWATRLRWRLRGAVQWPTFLLAVALTAAALVHLPVAGTQGPPWPGAVLLAGFLQLAAVAFLAPLAGRLWRRRRPDLPLSLAKDRAGAVLVLAVTSLVAGAGLAHRPAIREAEEDLAAADAAVQRYVLREADPEFHRNAPFRDTIRLEDDLYRSCVPGDDPNRPLCLVVRTGQSPPGITVDEDRAGNDEYRRGGGF